MSVVCVVGNFILLPTFLRFLEAFAMGFYGVQSYDKAVGSVH